METDRRDTEALRPREARMNVRLKAMLWSDRLDPREIEIRNLSRRGAGARGHIDASAVGERITIQFARLPPVSGSVRWSRGDQFGVMLDQDIDPEALAATEETVPPRPGIDLDF